MLPLRELIAQRLALEIMRLAYGKAVVARGPELVSASFAGSELTITLSNSSLVVHHGVVVRPPTKGCGNQTMSTAVTQVVAGRRARAAMVPFKIDGAKVVVSCKPGTEQEPVLINGDASNCFLYSSQSGLPAPPLAVTCGAQ